MKDSDFKITIPKLKNRASYKQWNRGIRTYLSSKNLLLYIDLDVQRPILLTETPVRIIRSNENVLDETHTLSTNDDLNPQQPSSFLIGQVKMKLKVNDTDNICSQICKFPISLLHQIINASSAKWFTIESIQLPDLLVELASEALTVIDVDNKLYHLYGSRESFVEARSKHLKQSNLVQSIVRTTISTENLYLFDNQDSVFMGYKRVCKQFFRDNRLERIAVKAKLSQLKVRSLFSYVNDFKRLLCEFESAGGSRESEDILNIFLSNLPNSKYLVYKTMFHGSSVDEAFEMFLNIAE